MYLKPKPNLLLATLLLVSAMAASAEAQAPKPDQPPAHTLNDPTRPVYHLVSQVKGSHIADPNFALYWKGRYHLFYITARNSVTKKRWFSASSAAIFCQISMI
jgi:sucrose-6-phosphate hydrolase SacC (GH32 family)